MIYITYYENKNFYPYIPSIFYSILKNKGYDVKLTSNIIDIQSSKENDILCISMIYSKYIDFYDQVVKEFKGDRIIIGGDCASGYGYDYWKNRWNKNIQLVQGRGEEAIVQTVENEEEKIIHGNLTDLNNIPFPDYNLIKINNYDLGFEYQSYELFQNELKDKFKSYQDWRKNYAFIYASRGCGNNCSFCTNILMHNNKYKFKSIERLKEEMLYLKSFGVNWLFFIDTDFGVSNKKLKEMCRMMIDNNINLYWDAEGVGQNWDLESLELMKESKCFYIRFGLESASQEVRKEFNKQRINIDKIANTIKLANSIDLKTHLNLIIGAQCETDKTIWDTINYINKNKVNYYSISYLTSYIGTEIYKKVNKETDTPFHSLNKLNNWKKLIIDNTTAICEDFLPKNEKEYIRFKTEKNLK